MATYKSKIVPFFENAVASASVLTILAISVERYRVVYRPFTGIADSLRKVIRTVIVIWLVCGVSSVPWLHIARLKDSHHLDGTPIKVCRMPVYLQWHHVYIVLSTVLFFILPCTILFILYCRVCCILHTVRMENSDIGQSQRYTDQKLLRTQVVNTIACVVLLFFICHLPFRVIGLWFTFENEETIVGLGLETYYNILYTGRVMFYLNHALNPIIYNFLSTKFRSALRYTCTCSQKGQLVSYVSTKRRQNNGNCAAVGRSPHKVANKDRFPHNSQLNRSSSTSSERQRRNEFFPMYAHIIEGSVGHDAAPDQCQLRIHLMDKHIAVNTCIHYTDNRNKVLQTL